MKAVEIKKGIYWVGAIDWDLRSFHGYTTGRGSTYNAYLIIDDKITLVDTVKEHLFPEMLERIKSVIDPTKIDYIVSNHVEMDHSGGLPKIKEICPNALIITSPNGEKGLKSHYSFDWDYKVVNTGDSINIGKRNLNFVLIQMVHWPDSMVTYIPEEKLLLPNDAFGQHIASFERFDDEIGWDILEEEASKYYANIVMVAPSHGIIWRKNINRIIGCYNKWSQNKTDKKCVIIYDTMWGSTGKVAKVLYDVFEESGIKVKLLNLKINDISDVMKEVLTAEYICVGSPTLNNNMLPTVSGFLTYLKGLAPKGRKALCFGSYGWGGQSINDIKEILTQCNFNCIEEIKVQYIPNEKELEDIKCRVKKAI